MGNFKYTKWPHFSYSNGRKRTFDQCLRKYFYEYYANWNGWRWNASELSRRVYRLKKLKNMYLITGEYLHLAFKIALEEIKYKRTDLCDANYLNTMVFDKLHSAIESSKQYNEWLKDPKKIMLMEYYYGEGVTKDIKIKIRDLVRSININFFNSDTWEQVYSENIDLLEIDKNTYEYIEIDNIRIYCMLDLLLKIDGENYLIVDWKTGKFSKKDKEQMLIYAYFISNKYKIPIENIKCRIEYLQSTEKIEFGFMNDDIEALKLDIIKDVKKMKEYILDKDIKNNIPIDMYDFQVTDDRSNCTFCNYKELC